MEIQHSQRGELTAVDRNLVCILRVVIDLTSGGVIVLFPFKVFTADEKLDNNLKQRLIFLQVCTNISLVCTLAYQR